MSPNLLNDLLGGRGWWLVKGALGSGAPNFKKLFASNVLESGPVVSTTGNI